MRYRKLGNTGLDVSVITNSGVKHTSEEGVTSLGPGVERDWTFEFPLDSGEWTFSLIYILKSYSSSLPFVTRLWKLFYFIRVSVG